MRGLAILIGCDLAGVGLAPRVGVPGPVLGLLLCLALLALAPRLRGVVERSGTALLSVLGVLFVPACVGALGQADRLASAVVPLAVGLVAGGVVTLGVTAVVLQAALARRPAHRAAGGMLAGVR